VSLAPSQPLWLREPGRSLLGPSEFKREISHSSDWVDEYRKAKDANLKRPNREAFSSSEEEER
jgi:hypothetical protein